MDESFDIYDDVSYGSRDNDQKDNEDNFSLYDDLETSANVKHEEASSPPRREPSRHSPRSDHEEDIHMSDNSSSDQSSAIYVGNLTWWTTDRDLEDILSEFGRIKSLKFIEEKVNGKSKGFACVEFYNSEAARNAKDKIHDSDIHGRQCVVELLSPQALKQLNKPTASTGKKKEEMKKEQPPKGRGARDPSRPPKGYAGSNMPMGMMPMHGRGRGGGFPMGMPDPRMMGAFPIAPHINPAFLAEGFRDDRDRDRGDRDRYRDSDRHRDSDRDRDRRHDDRRDRSPDRKRDREDDRHRRESRDDDRKRHKDRDRKH